MWFNKLPNNLGKVFVSLVMWVGLLSISIGAMIEHGDKSGFTLVPLVLVPLVLAIAGTALLWVIPDMNKNAYDAISTRIEGQEKTKRRSRREEQLDLLMDLLSEEELVVFKEKLQQRVLEDSGYDDGELPYTGETSATLLEDEPQARQQRG